MTFLGRTGKKWASEDSVINAATKFEMPKDGLIVNDTQQEEFCKAANLIAQNQEQGFF